MLPNSVKKEGAYSEGGNDVAGDQGFGDGPGWGAAHMAEPVEHRGWDVDRPGLWERRILTEVEGGQSVEVDQGHENRFYEDRSLSTLSVPTFPHDHYQQGGVCEARKAGVLDGLCVDVDCTKES